MSDLEFIAQGRCKQGEGQAKTYQVRVLIAALVGLSEYPGLWVRTRVMQDQAGFNGLLDINNVVACLVRQTLTFGLAREAGIL